MLQFQIYIIFSYTQNIIDVVSNKKKKKKIFLKSELKYNEAIKFNANFFDQTNE